MVNRESITHNPHNKTSVSQSVTKGSSRDASASKNTKYGGWLCQHTNHRTIFQTGSNLESPKYKVQKLQNVKACGESASRPD